MADKTGLKLIGWMLGSMTAAVMLIAAVLVHDAVANPTDTKSAAYSFAE